MRMQRFRGLVRIFGIIVLGASLVVIGNMAGVQRIFSPFGRAAVPLAAPVFRARTGMRDWIRIHIGASAHAKRADLAEEKARALFKENVRLKELELENAHLRGELDFFERTRYPLAVARVVGRIRENGVTFLVIGRGGSDGIALRAPVLTDGVMVGKIVKVQPSVAIAAPLGAPGLKTAAAFPGSAETVGIVEGSSTGGYIMRLIPKDTAVYEGMTVITSGLEEGIPRGLVIGTIERIEAGEGNLYQEAYAAGPVRHEAISLVSVLVPIAAQ